MNRSARFVLLWCAALTALWWVGACGGDESTAGFGGGTSVAGGGPTGGAGGNSTSSGANTDDDGDGYTEGQGDCNDANPAVHPGTVEICGDGLDNNCNGATDEAEPDGDGDGFGMCQGDCNDADPAINPAAAEVPDGIDNNCDGVIDADYDGDGYTEAQGDCDDADPKVNPGAVEDCFDGVDNDCNGYIDDAEPDLDNDGYGPCEGDCAEGDPNIGPGQPEIDGDGIDNNCDNLVDLDIDGDGWTTTNGDCDDGNPAINPAALEICGDNIDNDCDGTTDTDCLTGCQLAELERSSVGCTYFAIDNDNHNGYDALQYAVVVSNIDAVTTANVDVQVRQGNVWQTITSAAVAPLDLYQFNLADRHIDNTGIHVAGAYRVVSDLPVVAYQFEPVDGVSSYTSDASLLLPTSALDSYYYVVGWGDSYGDAQMNIVAAGDGTTVTITPSVLTEAGGGIPALQPGVPYTFPQTLAAGDYIQLEGVDGFTGTYVTSNKPVSVFSTHWCANIPSLSYCCCDHIEEEMFGLQTWGKSYVGARLPVRSSGTPDPTFWHLFASEDGTSVSFTANPAVTGLPASPQAMNKGDFLTLEVSGNGANPGDFAVTADKPIFLMEYLSSSFYTNAPAAQAGDPAMTQQVPVEQYLDHYVVLVPLNWVYDFMVITKAVGSTVNLDGTAVPQNQFTAIDDTINPPQWEVARVSVPDGVHQLDSSAPFGVVVVGYDSYDSYAYPGGLDQQLINPIN